VESVFCCITYPDRTGFTTMGTSVFVAAANALEWVEVHRRDFGTARQFRDDEILRIGGGMVPDRWYRVGGTGSLFRRQPLADCFGHPNKFVEIARRFV
jgi:hypothetical protein